MNAIRAIAITLVLCLAGWAADAKTLYVDVDNVSGTENGTSWATAYRTIGQAVTAATANDSVWVAEGSYAETVTMKTNVALYGGFSGPGSVFADRDPRAHVTLITGEGIRRCVVGADGARLDGFTLDQGWTSDGGGGMLNEDASPTVANCEFIYCYATSNGAAVRNWQASPVFEDCTFRMNSTYYTGGAVENLALAGEARFTRCLFQDNQSFIGGGGVMNYYTSTRCVFEECTFIRNRTTAGSGGGLYNGDGAQAELVRCVFVNNTSPKTGGGVYSDSDLTVAECAFSGNSSASGGGIWQTGAVLSVTGSRFSGNISGVEGGGGLFHTEGTATISGCLFCGNEAQDGGGGGLYGGNGADTVVHASRFLGNRAAWGGGLCHAGAALEISGSIINANTAGHDGGGFYIGGVDAVFDTCTVRANSAEMVGGGGWCWGGVPGFASCVFEDNTGGDGGAVHAGFMSRPTFEKTIFRRNHGSIGGALHLDGADTTSLNCLFFGNCAATGGALWQAQGELTLNHCTVSRNVATDGSAIMSNDAHGLNISNCIVRENRGGGPTINVSMCPLSITNSDLPGGPAYTDSLLDEAPMFYAPEFEDFRLQAGSPCINAGVGGCPDDLRGKPRTGAPDMGCYERQTFEDLDGDQIGDGVEGFDDTDADGTPDYMDNDSDNDGIPDVTDGVADFDEDGTANFRDADSGTPVVGDINGDGKINAIDVQMAVNGALGIPIESL